MDVYSTHSDIMDGTVRWHHGCSWYGDTMDAHAIVTSWMFTVHTVMSWMSTVQWCHGCLRYGDIMDVHSTMTSWMSTVQWHHGCSQYSEAGTKIRCLDGENKSSSLLTEERTLKEGQCVPRCGTLSQRWFRGSPHPFFFKTTKYEYFIYYKYILQTIELVTKFLN